MLDDAYLADAETRAKRFMGQWTGTAGSLAADVIRLLRERTTILEELESMTIALEDANAKLRDAVEARLGGCCDGGRCHSQPEAIDEKGPMPEPEEDEDDESHRIPEDWILRGEQELRLTGDGVLAAPVDESGNVVGDPKWLAGLERLRQLHYEKTAQYGGAEDAFENVTASAKCGVEPWRRALCDLSDCVVRMQKFAQGQPVDTDNALLDAANWALICYVKLQEEKESHANR